MHAREQNVVVGVNASMGSLSIEQQNTILAELHAAGARFIRTGITPDAFRKSGRSHLASSHPSVYS
jgi:hypothetical protein